MDENKRAALYRRVVAAAETRRSDADAAGGQVPVANYLDAQRLKGEVALIRSYPQPLLSSSSLPQAGDWMSLTYGGTPLLLVRQQSGEVRAFLNVCRHRGARVVPEGSGHRAGAFVCPYHAWTYRPDGALRGVPQATGFPKLEPEKCGLKRLPVSERIGLIWVLRDGGKHDADSGAWHGALMDELEAYAGLKNAVGYAPRTYEVRANWKLLVDGVFEAYHFKVAHRATIAHLFADNLQLVDEYDEVNRRLYLVKKSFLEEKPALEEFEPRKYANITHFFFPNVTILLQPDHAQLSVLEPLSEESTRIHEITLLPEMPSSEKAEKYWNANVELYRETLGEDYALAESIQSGLLSGANSALTFGNFEFSAVRFHEQLQERLKAI